MSAEEIAPQRTALRKASNRRGVVEAFGRWQGRALIDLRARLDLPDHLQFLAEGVILDGCQADQVMRAVAGVQGRGEGRARQ